MKHAFETKNHIHYSPASLSIIKESHVFVVFLKDRLRGPNRTKDGPESFLHIAAQVGHKPVFVLLQQFKPEYQAHGMPLSTSVWCSLSFNSLVCYLGGDLTCQAALSSRNVEKQTPLHIAAMRGHSAICTIMLDHKASVTEVDDMDRLPIHGVSLAV